jgi:putative nucleotide binding protein
MQRSKEENGIILDFLPNGYPFDPRPSFKKTPIVQIIGSTHFVLLECVPKKEVFLRPFEDIYIGEGKRDKIHHIAGRLSPDKLTSTAKSNLEFVIKDLLMKNEADFIDFFNTAGPLTTRMHQLQLLPGIGKKHMWEIIEKRGDEPFKSFEDIKKRVKLLPDPLKVVIKRIIAEIEGKDKHRIFVE